MGGSGSRSNVNSLLEAKSIERNANGMTSILCKTSMHVPSPLMSTQKSFQTSIWNNLHPHQVVGTAAILKEIDCLTATVSDILKVRSNFSLSIATDDIKLCGFGGWFDVHFRGRKEDPAQQEIELTTAPSIDYYTHWGQQVFLLHPPIHVYEGDELNVSFLMYRAKENHRLMEVELGCEILQASGKRLVPLKNKFYLE